MGGYIILCKLHVNTKEKLGQVFCRCIILFHSLKFHSSAMFMVSTTCIMMLVFSYALFMENKQMGHV
jgi:hypothetical protein